MFFWVFLFAKNTNFLLKGGDRFVHGGYSWCNFVLVKCLDWSNFLDRTGNFEIFRLPVEQRHQAHFFF